MRLGRLTAASTLFVAAIPLAAAENGIVHERLKCVPPGANAKVVAPIPAGEAASSVRVYFRARDAKDEHYVEMLRGADDRFWGVFPVTSGKTGPVLYRVVMKTASGRQVATDTVTVPVSLPCPVKLTEEEVRSARNLVVGHTKPAQPDVPYGFECFGIAGRISADGELRAIAPCNQAGWYSGSGGVRTGSGGVAAAGNPCDGCTPADGSLVPGGTGGVSVPGGVIPPPTPVSPSRPKPE